MTQITTKAQAKTLVSALRRELKSMNKSSSALSHNECLTVMARALGFSSWNQWEAKLTDAPEAIAAVIPAAQSKYPLVNHGDFDFVAAGEQGTPMTGHFVKLEGLLETCPCQADVSLVQRSPYNPKTNSSLTLDYSGGSSMFWDDQKTQQRNGQDIWLDDDGEEHLELQVIILPEDYDGDPREDDDLPVRPKLVDAFVAYCKDKGLTAEQLRTTLAAAEEEVGFALTNNELDCVAAQL